jgi:oligopeptidase B
LTKFPDLLVKAGLFDPRVQYWEPAKWVAKLRTLEVTDSSPESKRGLLLFDCKMGSGHFGSSGRYTYLKEAAADYAFIVDRIARKQSEIKL